MLPKLTMQKLWSEDSVEIIYLIIMTIKNLNISALWRIKLIVTTQHVQKNYRTFPYIQTDRK